MTDHWDKYVKPIPILQWLVIMVLCAELLHDIQSLADNRKISGFILALLGLNVVFLHGLPRFLSVSTVSTALVLLDTGLVPLTLYLTHNSASDLLVVYFGIIMIAAASGDVKRALSLSAVTWLAYGVFNQFNVTDPEPLSTVLLRLPFFLVVTLFYGAMAEYAYKAGRDKEQFAYAATHDELTGLPNRRFLLETLHRELEAAVRFQTPLSCAIMDVDHFKRVNDTHGHDCGDLVLRDYSTLLSAQSRGYDVAGRMGGDEYVWVMPRVEREGAVAAGERLRRAVEEHRFGKVESLLTVTTSIGVTTYTPDGSSPPTPDQLLKVADLALYEAKTLGRNRVCHQVYVHSRVAPGLHDVPA